VSRKRLAAIDIGTNSIRCIVVELDKAGKYKILDDEKATVRLGEGLARDQSISAAAWQRAVEALSRMKKVVDGYGVAAVEAVATSAVRQAANGEAWVKAVAAQVGLPITVISGEQEAELAVASALHNFDMEGVHYAVADIGGGSVEIVTAMGSHVEELRSLELGAVVLTDQFVTSDPLTRVDHQRLRRQIRKTLKSAFPDARPPLQCLIGSGGTMAAIAGMVMAMRKEGYGSIHGYEVLRSEVVHLLAMLLRKGIKERRTLPGLHPDRADIIVAGVTVADELMAFFSANLLRVNERGIREGLILGALKKRRLIPALARPRSWRHGVLEFARSCHHDEGHAMHVARLAMAICDALAFMFSFGKKERQLLEAAALLHDVGYFISYAGHHKHSYHLVRHADLFGFTPREREIIAQIARYHRKALPKKKHQEFVRLTPQDQLLVRRLGGILRLADGLDRRRAGTVTAIDCTIAPSAVTFALHGGEDVGVELFGGKAKGDLFEAAFGKKLILVSARETAQLHAEAVAPAGSRSSASVGRTGRRPPL
jgi:exopolyphosphatase/guanosine-5'-triphosphate,3'-diphosphate pyrophosphatase